MKNKDLEIIKDNFGERFMHLCRSLFPSILETEGLLSTIILKRFAPSRSLIDDLNDRYLQDDFKNFIFDFVDVEQATPKEAQQKTPEQLFDEAGYVLYPECKTEEEIQAFKKYYRAGERLCTFNGGRLNSCRVWFAVKKNVDEIKREDFLIPQRQDEYGTSVISIQFTKGNNSTLSIKNRYNHAVNNPDATFSNNLENIMPGLESAFEQTYGTHLQAFSQNGLEIPDYVLGGDGKYYKYNYEIEGCYLCENNVFIKQNGEVTHFDKSNFLLFDNYLLDLKEKKLSCLIDSEDNFDKLIQDIKKIDITYDLDENKRKTENRIITITPEKGEPVVIKIDKNNRMIEYSNPNIDVLPDWCFSFDRYLKKINLPNLTYGGDHCFYFCSALTEINLPNLKMCGENCFYNCRSLQNIDLPNLTTCENDCFNDCNLLENINLPKLKYCERECFVRCDLLKNVNLPSLRHCFNKCFRGCNALKELDLPNLISCGYDCFNNCELLTNLNLPNLTTCEDDCFCDCYSLANIDLSSLRSCKRNCFKKCDSLTKINLPKLITCDKGCFSRCRALTSIDLPHLESCKDDCFYYCSALTEVNLPNLEQCGDICFCNCRSLAEIDLPKLTTCGVTSFNSCLTLTNVNLPNLVQIGGGCFCECPALESIKIKKESNSTISGIKKYLEHSGVTLKENYLEDDVVVNLKPINMLKK